MKKKFLLYLIPISINIALSVLWVIYHAYEQDIWIEHNVYIVEQHTFDADNFDFHMSNFS